MTLISIGEVTIPKNYLYLLINQSLSIDKIKNKKEQMLRAPYEDSKKIVLFFFNFFSVASWVVERGTGFSDMNAGMWLVSAFFKIEYWKFLIYDFVKPLKIWTYLDNFFFHGFQWGDQRKNAEKLPKLYVVFFSIFPLVPPLEAMKKKDP